MKSFFLVLFITLVAGLAGSLSAQNRFWVAAGVSNWNNAANWSTTSGGAGGASIPGTGGSEVPIFNANGLGNCNLDIAPVVPGITVNGYTGTIDLVGNTLTTTGTNTFATGTIVNTGGAAFLALNTTNTTTFSGTQFSANINGTTGGLNFNGSVFNGTVAITKSDNATYNGQGGNTFNNALTITTLGGGELRFAVTNPDTFSAVTLNINGTGSTYIARNAAGNLFNGNISVNYNSTGNAFFGSNGGTSTLAVGRTITASCGASGCRNLSLANFTQAGATPQILTLSGNPNATLTLGPNSAFNGSLTFTSEEIIFNSSTFTNTSIFTQTGANSISSRGGNSFQTVTFNNTGTGDIHLGTNAADAGDIFNLDATFNNTGGGRIRIGSNTAGNLFVGNLTLNNTSVVDVQSRIQISRFNGASTVIQGTTTVNNLGDASDIHMSFDAGSLTTFNGNVVINNAPTSTGDFHWGGSGDIIMNGDLTISNTTNNNLQFGTGVGTVNFGNGTISLGGAGFTAGQLRFRNFTQSGASAVNLALTGATALLQLGPNASFGGNVTAQAPQLLLNGVTVAGTATLEKTGATDNAGTGGNVFNGTTTITHSGPSGYLMMGNGTADQFNGSTTFNNTGGYRIYLAYNHAGQTTTFGSDVTFNANKTGGADAWSFLVAESTDTHLSFGGNVTVNCDGTLQSNMRFLNNAANTATYAGVVTINATNTHPSTTITMGTAGTSTYNNHIIVSNVGGGGGSNGIYFNTGATSSSTLAATRTITIGAGGFSEGTLGLRNFTQLGATSQTLNTFSGTASLVVGPNSAFGGDVEFRAPQLYLNGCTYSGTGTFEKNGTSNDVGTGGNIFTGVTTITNSGSGYLLLGNGSRDRFLSAATFNNTGSYRIYFSHNHPGETTEFLSSLTLNSNKTGGADSWSYMVAEGANSGLSVGGLLTINCDGAIQSNHRFLTGAGSSGTFAGLTINLTNSHPSTSISMGENGTSTYSADIAVSNSGGAAGITFNQNASASSILNGSLSSGIFSNGSLNLYRFSQLGAIPQNLTLTVDGTILRVGPNSSFDGAVTFISPRLFLNGATYNNVTYLEKNGTGDDGSLGNNIFTTDAAIVNSSSDYLRTNGNNTFGGTTTITNSGSDDILLELTTGSIYNGDVTFNNTGSSRIRVAYLGATSFNGNIIVNNPTGTGVLFCESVTATATLADTKTISVGGGGFNAGSLNLIRFTQLGGTPQALTLTGTSLLTLGPSSTFNGNVTFASPRVLLNGTTYNGTTTLQKTSVTNDDGSGGNVFNSAATIINSGDSYLRTAATSPDIFNGPLTLTNTGASTIRMADNSAGNQFNGNIELNSTFGGGIYFGNSVSGTATLANGRTIGVGTSGVISGDIRLIRFTQVGPTAQALDLTGIAVLTLGPTSSFGGDVDFRSPQLLLNGTTFTGTTYLEKKGATDNPGNGGNTFNGITSLVNSGSGYLMTANTAPDIFNNSLTVSNTGSNIIYLAYNVAGNQFNGNITFNSTLGSAGIYFANTGTGAATLGNGASMTVGGLGFSSGNLRFRRFTQVGAAAQTLLLTGTALMELGPTSTFNGNVDFRAPQFLLNGCTFNGTTYLEKTGATNNDSNGGNSFNGATTIANSGSGYFRFAVNTLDTFNGDLTITNTGASTIRMADVIAGTVFNGNIQVNSTSGNGIYFGNGGGSASMIAGRTITVGGSGFTIGELQLIRFTQLGATNQNLVLTGTALLRLGPTTTFNGNVDFRSPQLLINGGSFVGTAYLEKTGATDNTGNGNTTFGSTTSIVSSGSGFLRTNGNNIFNGTTNITNAGPRDLLLELNTASTYNGDVTFTNTNSSYVRVAYTGANIFNGNIAVNSTSGTGVYFCENAAGTATLANGRTISVGGTGFTAGELRLQRFTQTGGTAQSLALTGASSLRTGPATTWNGNFTASSPLVFLDGTTFNGVTNNITKTGTTTDTSVGGNVFSLGTTTTITNSSTGIFRLGNGTADDFIGNVIFNQTSGSLQPAYNVVSTFRGDVTVNGTAAITFGAAAGTATFTGTVNQNVNKTGTASPIFRRLVMNKASGTLTMNTDALVSVTATFTSGIINTTSTNYIDFADNATAIGANNFSFVDGPVRKTGNDAFTFPIGDNTFYRPAAISAPTGTAHFFTAQYFNADHGLGSVGDPSFTSISKCEYWTIDRNPGPTSNVLVTLSWQEAACVVGYITDPATIRVARWNGASWTNHGNGGTTGTATNGTIVTSGAVTAFSPFTLASVSLANPLPVELTWFNASITKDGTGLLKWHTESELNNDRFEIERSENGIDFTSLGSVAGAGTSNQAHDYQFEDKEPILSLVYYRLKQVDFDGEFEYSSIVSLDFTDPESGSGRLFVSPNPINSGSFASFSSGTKTVRQTVTIYNNLNQEVRKFSEVEGFSTDGLTPGIYIVRNKAGEIFRLVIK